MEENLLAFLRNPQDPDAQRQVEVYFRGHPEDQPRLERLRQAFAPLEGDREVDEPPPGLWQNTLALVAEHQCRKLPQAPLIHAIPLRRAWRWADLAVAASILLCLGLFGFSIAARMQLRYQEKACALNLAQLGTALAEYRDMQPTREYPNPARLPQPLNVAGMAMPMLHEAGLAQNVSIRCPASGPPKGNTWTTQALRELSAQDFNGCSRTLLGSYAYGLGYNNVDGFVQGYRMSDGTVPIMTDAPPQDVANVASLANSPNHRGRGQNVLLTDGSVQFVPTRVLANDDIFLNRKCEVRPGLNRDDFVVGTGETELR